MLMDIERGHRANSFAKKGPQPSGALGPCFRCHGDHWVRDFPMDQLEKGVTSESHWPRVPHYCEDFGIEH